MSYTDAKKCFKDIKNYINVNTSPVEWNLSTGLHSLSSAVEKDLNEIKKLVRQVLSEVKSLE